MLAYDTAAVLCSLKRLLLRDTAANGNAMPTGLITCVNIHEMSVPANLDTHLAPASNASNTLLSQRTRSTALYAIPPSGRPAS